MNYVRYFKRPEPVDTLPEDAVITSISAGKNYNYAINSATNEVYSWGFGENYVLGTKEDESVYLP